MRKFLLLLLLPFLAEAQVAPEASARVTLTIADANFAFVLQVENTSTAPVSITSVELTLGPSTMRWDTFGTITPASALNPDVGGNADGQSAQTVTITPTVPLGPAQVLRSGSAADIDPNGLNAFTGVVRFTSGDALPFNAVSATNVWTANVSKVIAETYPLKLTWINPTLNEDNTPYTNPRGTKIYWNTVPDGVYPATNTVLIENPSATEYTIRMPKGEWYFLATAVNLDNKESVPSNVVKGVAAAASDPPVLDPIQTDLEGDGLAWLVFTIRNQILFVEAGTVNPGAACDPEQYVRGTLPTDSMPHTLNLVAVEDVTLLPSIPNGELAVFAECSAP